MNTTVILSLLFFNLVIIFVFVLQFLKLKGRINKLEKKHTDLKQMFEENVDGNSYLYDYCLKTIIKEAVIKEDFETAQRCQILLLNSIDIRERQKKINEKKDKLKSHKK